jgi:glycosyltransferase involved in cell wall biosynthesis
MLARAVGSALADPRTAEVLVVNDGSTDNSVEELGLIGDSRLRVLSVPHLGNVAALRNRGARAATHDWLAFLDSDDFWLPGKLDAQLAALRSDGTQWSFTGWEFVHENASPLGVPFVNPAPSGHDLVPGLLACEVSAPIPSLVVRRDLFLRVGGCDETLFHDDFDLMLKLAESGPASVVSPPFLRITKDSRRTPTPADSVRHHVETIAVLANCRARATTPSIRRLCNLRLAVHHRILARAHRFNASPRRSLAALAHSLVHLFACVYEPRRLRKLCGCIPRNGTSGKPKPALE